MKRDDIGSYAGTLIDVAGWDGVEAQVDLSCACMFTKEAAGHSMSGGLLHLNEVLGGALARLRAEGVFAGRSLETLLLSDPPVSASARAILIIGLGDIDRWTPDVMTRAVGLAARFAIARGDCSVAFAPSMLDAGIKPTATVNAASAMMSGLREALDAQQRLELIGFAAPTTLSHWTFDTGVERFAGTAAAFKTALRSPRAPADGAATPS